MTNQSSAEQIKLTAKNVERVAIDCLFRLGEATEPRVEVEGITNKFGFHPDRLRSHKEEIKAMLEQLPDDFKISHGGGMTFLNACMTKSGEQWGEHRDMEMLFCLAIGVGLAEWLLPRDTWEALPGSMPYVGVKV